MNSMEWVLFDRTEGATTHGGKKLDAEALALIAQAVQEQVNTEFTKEWGSNAKVRVGKNASDIHAGEWAFIFLPKLPDAPADASAFHDITAKGVPYALCAVPTCEDLFGPDGVSVDVSHEILETAGDEGANLYAYDNKGSLHALEMCDAVEIQTYAKRLDGGIEVQVSNWLMRSWFIPGAKGPYDYMTSAHLPGAVAPPGPLLTAPGHGGNYQIIGKWTDNTKDVKGAHALLANVPVEHHIDGVRRKGSVPHWSSRTALRLAEMARNDYAPGELPASMRHYGRNRILGSRLR